MSKNIHNELASGRWAEFSLAEQLANIGSEVNRSIISFEKKDTMRLDKAIERTLELFDLSIADKRWKNRLKELVRSREVYCSLFYEPQIYMNIKFEMNLLNDYFTQFAILVRANR